MTDIVTLPPRERLTFASLTFGILLTRAEIACVSTSSIGLDFGILATVTINSSISISAPTTTTSSTSRRELFEINTAASERSPNRTTVSSIRNLLLPLALIISIRRSCILGLISTINRNQSFQFLQLAEYQILNIRNLR